MKYLVTGGAGFIGSAFIRKVIEKEENFVLNLDALHYPGNLETLSTALEHQNYSFKKIDLTDNIKINEVINDFSPNQIVHFAAESHVDVSIANPVIFINSNIIGTYNLLQASLDYYKTLNETEKNKFLFINISTDEIFGDFVNSIGNDAGFNEKSFISPSSPYSASKASAQHLVYSWYKTFNLPTISTNCSNNFGKYQNKEKFIPKIIKSIISSKKIPVYGNGMQKRDWIHVDDHIRAILKVGEKAEVGSSYNIGGDNYISNLELIKLILEIIKNKTTLLKNHTKFDDVIEFVKDRPGHDVAYKVDSSKIIKELGWRPLLSFNNSLTDTVSWYLENQEWLEY